MLREKGQVRYGGGFHRKISYVLAGNSNAKERGKTVLTV